MRKPVFLINLFIVSLFLPGSAAAVEHYGDITIQPMVFGGGKTVFGYVEYRITITNAGTGPHTVRLVMPPTSHGYGNYIRQMTRSVTVPAGTVSTVSLFQLPLRMSGSGAEVFIDGRKQRDTLGLTNPNHCEYYYGGGLNCCVLVSQQIGYDAVNEGSATVFENSRTGIPGSGMGYYGPGNGLSLALSELPVSDWSRNWLSYSRYNGIMLTGNEWRQMPPQVKRSILEYVRCGGSLTVVGPTELDVSMTSQDNELNAFQTSYSGFGVVHHSDQIPIIRWQKDDWQLLKDTWLGCSKALQNSKTVKAANDWFPVIEDLTIPVRGLLLIVLIFAILIGPANLFILGRKKRQIWLLWTVPLLSIIASVIIFGYASFAEGWKGYSRTISVTVLDEPKNLASTIGVTAFYCPMTPRGGLHFDYETECSAQIERDYGSGHSRSIDWTQDQHLKSGWISARVPSHFKLRKSQMRREKVVFSEQAGQWEALNGLGVQVASLYYADVAGNVYKAENIAPGKKVQLTRLDAALPFRTQNPELLKRVFEADWVSTTATMAKEPLNYLRPNCYIAVTNESLFVEKALEKPTLETVESVIYGISQGVADAG